METKNIILKLRTERGMSQDELADKNHGNKAGGITLGKW